MAADPKSGMDLGELARTICMPLSSMKKLNDAYTEMKKLDRMSNIARKLARETKECEAKIAKIKEDIGRVARFFDPFGEDMDPTDYISSRVDEDPRLRSACAARDKLIAKQAKQTTKIRDALRDGLLIKVVLFLAEIGAIVKTIGEMDQSSKALVRHQSRVQELVEEVNEILLDQDERVEEGIPMTDGFKERQEQKWNRVFRSLRNLRKEIDGIRKSADSAAMAHGVGFVSSALSVAGTVASWSAIGWSGFDAVDGAFIAMDGIAGVGHAAAAVKCWKVSGEASALIAEIDRALASMREFAKLHDISIPI